MTIKEQMRLLEKALEPWAAANAGSVKVANDKPHLFQLLGAGPGAPRAAVYFVEERPRSRSVVENLDEIETRPVVVARATAIIKEMIQCD